MIRRSFLFATAVLLVLVSVSCNMNNTPDTEAFDEGVSWTRLEAEFTDASDNPIADLVIGAVSAETGRVFSSVTDAAGLVSIRVPQDGSYMLSVLSKEGKSYGSAVIHSQTLSRPVSTTDVMGLKSPDTADPLDLGTVVLPADPTTAPVVVTVPDASVDGTLLANVDGNGVPVGTANYGKPDTASGALPSGSYSGDPDLDGLPNVIDSDDDGDGILDDWDPDADGDDSEDDPADAAEVTPVEFRVGYLLDIRGASNGIYSYFNGDEYDALVRDMRADLWVGIYDPARIDAVTSVALYIDSSPSYADTLIPSEFDPYDTEQTFADGSTYDSGTPSGIWVAMVNGDAVPYQLSVSDGDSDTDRLVLRNGLKLPSGSADLYEVGDVFTVEIRYEADSGFDTEYYSEMVNYIYDNVTRFQGFALKESGVDPVPGDFTNVWDGVAGTYPGDDDEPIELTYDTTDQDIWFKIIPPLDDDGDYITTGTFRYEIFDAEHVTTHSRTWQAPVDGHCRYDSDLADETLIDSADPQYYQIPIPVEYIIDTDEDGDTEIDIEYFMSINDESYIKNRLRFSIAPAAAE